MQATPRHADRFIDRYELAERIGLNLEFIRRETAANRLPHIRVGRRTLYDPQQVRDALLQRAAEAVQ